MPAMSSMGGLSSSGSQSMVGFGSGPQPEGQRQTDATGSAASTRSQGLAAHIGEEVANFLNRGQSSSNLQARCDSKPRDRAASGGGGGGGRSQVHPAAVFLKQWHAAWATATGATSDQVRLTGVQVVQNEAILNCGSSFSQSPCLLDVSFVVQGVEVLVKVSVTGLQEWASGSGSQAVVTAERASTKCRWEMAGRNVALASRVAAGRPLEDLLSALLASWNGDDDETSSESSSASGCNSPQHSTDVPEGFEGQYSPRDSEASFVSTEVSSRPMLRGEPKRESRGSVETKGSSFTSFLASRPPLLRFQHASRGLAWDHPPTKAEKHELLLLQLFSQEAQRQQELESIKTKTLSAPTSATPARSASCRSLPRPAA